MTTPQQHRTPDDVTRIAIVGASLAGANAAEALRASGYTGALVLIGDEAQPPYERPPLSKQIQLGAATPDSAYLHPLDWYAEHDIELLTGQPAADLDTTARTLRVGNRTVGYDRLLLATGSRPRRFAMADQSGAEVIYLRTLEDALALKARLSQRLFIVGAGWIGLEVAAAARAAGGTVTVVEAAPMPLARVLGDEVAQVFADLHRQHGVDLRTSTTLEQVTHQGGQTTVRLSDGTTVSADVLLVGIGAEPNSDLAAAAGLACDNGVLVDAQLRTSDAHVHAAGDVANHDHPLLGRLRVEHWDNAIEQGRHAARTMLGDTTAYQRQPYFFTDQYDLGMEYVGHVGRDGYDQVRIRGDLAGRVFTAYWTKGDRVLAGMHANDWDAIEEVRRLVGGPVAELPTG
ncbi:FAD-dependent oxidoreductase [Tessaracoccus sp. SD287]|uniref:NAD(P)/FAD-dependent oxidoreductase n=1 Tax=Tessaracoccus sp. SD287 TaxID=2782008 RepID=UPI001A95701C|nr:FAD-dependent oxidoreductase [Tessaracoccus sp. SD287]MBO1030080.1 FAD-dependent oxidoreductase [Tessaracoccus sp. SD287]